MKLPRESKYLMPLLLFVAASVVLLFQNCGEISIQQMTGPQKLNRATDPDEPVGPPTSPEDPDHYNDERELELGACGHFKIVHTLGNYKDISGETLPFDYIFQLVDAGSSGPYLPSPGVVQWHGEGVRDVSKSQITYTYDDVSCALHALEVEFPDKCGVSHRFGAIYTFEGCPPPINDTNPTEEDVIKPRNSQGVTMTRALVADTRVVVTTGPFTPRSIETLPLASYYPPTDPLPLATQWPMRGSYIYVKAPKDKYLSMEFHVPSGPDTHSILARLGEAYPCNFTVAISPFEGDFYIGRESKQCLVSNFVDTVLMGTTDSADPYGCHLEPGKKYYLNMVPTNLRNGAVPAEDGSCTQFYSLGFLRNGVQY